jgi:hypothetical protein
MLVLGLILLLLAAALLIGFLSSGTQEVTFDSGILDVTVNTLTIYLLGALTLLLLVAGLAMIRVGTRRATQRRKDKRELDRLKEERREADQTPTGTGTDSGTDTETVGEATSGTRPAPEAPTTASDQTTQTTVDGNGTTRT